MLIIFMKYTTIAVTQQVKEALSEYGHKGETYSQILDRILKATNVKQTESFLSVKDSIPIDQAIKQAKKKWQK